MQISGYITDEDGKKKIALVGKWNSYLDMQKCDEEGEALPGSELVRLWTVRSSFTQLVCLYGSKLFGSQHSIHSMTVFQIRAGLIYMVTRCGRMGC